MKFFMILISLLMTSFGMVCLVGVADMDGVKKTKEKVGYSSRSEEDRVKIDSCIVKFRNTAFILVTLGVCLFIASLFL